MDLSVFDEFIEWIDTFNGWMVYSVINAKSMTSAISESGDFLSSSFFCTGQKKNSL